MEPPQTYLSDPARLLHILISALAFYVFIVVLMRLSGKRTTANMNNFDWIITVGIGSIMASGILQSSVSMLDAMTAAAALAGMQWLTTWAVLRMGWLERLVKPRPRLLLERGARLEAEMRAERITEGEIRAALREAGLQHEGDARWVVIETDGQLSVVPFSEGQGAEDDLLAGVNRPGARPEGARRG